jgi:hypothetical protein
MPLILGANSVSGYNVANSLRFNTASTDFLSRTPASTTNRRTFTLSFWFKRSTLGTNSIAGAGDGTSSNRFNMQFGSTDELQIANSIAGVNTNLRTTTQLFRDVSAWYHLVVAIDTTQATASNRLKVYINGSEITAFTTSNDFTLNYDTYFNSTAYSARLGVSLSNHFSGYISEVNFIDGQALTPSSFGETDTLSGIWIPKSYSGSYGTNGFFLKFLNSASLGTDSSGNGNTWTVNNLTSIDQTTDTPTNNFATWNPLFALGNQTFTEGNLRLATGTTGGSIGTIAVNTGKWYWESKIISTATANARVAGISSLPATSLQVNGSATYRLTGVVEVNGTDQAYGASLTTNDIVGTAIDIDARSVTFYKNGTSQGALSLSSVYSVGDYITASVVYSSSTSTTMEINFGNPSFTIASGNTDGAGFGNFEYAVPSGYYALCTKNLANFG